MSKKNQQDETIVDVEQVYSKTEQWVETNQRNLLTAIGVLAVLIGGYFYYTKMYLPPLEEEAQLQLFQAQQYFEMDSLNWAMEGDNQGNLGFYQIAQDYGSTNAGELSKYYMGVCLLRTGDYEGAIDYLDSFSADDKMVYPNSLGLMGDAYSELGDYANAKLYYLKAADAGNNDYITPKYLMKAAMVAEELSQWNDALSYYERIQAEFDATQEGRVIKKFITRAKANL